MKLDNIKFILNKLKSKYVVLAALVLGILFMSSCSAADPQGSTASGGDDKLQIVTTIFPPYDFARNIAGRNADVSMLLKPGTESHSYEPSPSDIIKIMNCDIFIYTGGESDTWVDEILDSISENGRDIRIIKMLDVVDNAVEEEIVEGMQAGLLELNEHSEEEAASEIGGSGNGGGEDTARERSEEDGSNAAAEGSDEHEHETESEHAHEYDEHVWTSPRRAMQIVDAISNAVIELDPDNIDEYQMNTAIYLSLLSDLDQEYREAIESSKRDYIVFGDRFPFRYLADEYGLKYSAAFPGCSSESEPSAKTVAYLIDRVREEEIPAVFYIEFSNQKIADAIAEETGAKKLLLHSCHNLTSEQMNNGVTYLDLMRDNLENLKEALN